VKGESFILDSEVVGYDPKTKRYLPFQKISQRIKRKYEIEKMVKDYPVEVNVFDVLSYNGKNMMKEKQSERRKVLEKIILNKKYKVQETPKLVTSSESEAMKFFKESLKAGNEGLMVKSLDSVYVPGRRVGGWVKYKSFMEPLDLVIVGAEWGEGKRAKWLASFDLACKGKGKLLTVGKVGTGIKEKAEGVTFKQLTKELKPYVLETSGKHVVLKPKIVVEVGYEEIQKSPTYTSGYALRFPKVLRLRSDEKKVGDANTLQDIERLYKGQKKS
jgi:DNA ligase-1